MILKKNRRKPEPGMTAPRDLTAAEAEAAPAPCAPPEGQVLEVYPVQFSITLRLANRDDLPRLEWFGQLIHYRQIFLRTFADQQAGRRLMLVADVGNFPVGQIWIHLSDAEYDERYRQRRGYLYALRVLEPFRGKGIGTRLIQRAESLLVERGYRWSVIAVTKDNNAARRLYERLGYRVFTDDPGEWQYVDHLGNVHVVKEPSWMLQKRLQSEPAAAQTDRPVSEE